MSVSGEWGRTFWHLAESLEEALPRPTGSESFVCNVELNDVWVIVKTGKQLPLTGAVKTLYFAIFRETGALHRMPDGVSVENDPIELDEAVDDFKAFCRG